MNDQYSPLILPQLSTLVPDAPGGDGWLHEIKYDGYRLLCRKDGDRVDCFTGVICGVKLPEIAESIRRLAAKQIWLDGELVVMAGGWQILLWLSSAGGGKPQSGVPCLLRL